MTPFISPSISQQQALQILSERLHSFEAFADKPFAQAVNEEAEWHGTTDSLVIRIFGLGSSQQSNYLSARNAGVGSRQRIPYSGFVPNATEVANEKQRRFEERTRKTRASLRGMIKELEILAPEEQKTGVYRAGDPFSFYGDLTQILRTAAYRVLIVDAYFGREIFDLYLDLIPSNIAINVLVGDKSPTKASVIAVAKLFKSNRPKFELRESGLLHDRIVLIDNRCWVIGQSIKDAAHQKPTYMIEIADPEIRQTYNQVWSNSPIVQL
jgi:hypothetical protein